ncbi:lycopene cyclase domain-containing protein [Sinomonas susongensis]|uniref:lycopene cyclase domain-containing protein n=1 Tax=Sinomonas susongensis TaxID=1324851 RepID=UPI001107EDA8|nr:lycopene cyclase domain-containing protein [Sinomonas susongensis]
MAYLSFLLIGAACLVALDRRFRLFFWRGPRSATLVLVAGVAFFLVWDAAGILGGVFEHGSSPLATGVLLAPGLPLEEPFFLAFFCYTAMLLFTAAERVAGGRR